MVVVVGCSGASPDEGSESVSEAAINVDQFLYLRCGATGTGFTESNRLKSTSTANVFSLVYTVRQASMVTGFDTCLLTQTNRLDGSGTSRQNFSVRPPGTPLRVPTSGTFVSSSTNFETKYPATGSYQLTVNWAQKTFTVAAPCTPRTVAQACGADNCGSAPDGCGGTVSCGTCAAPTACSSTSGPGICTACPAGENRCGSACVNVQIDPNNCGACGRICASGQACCGGVCATVNTPCVPSGNTCSAGLLVCAGNSLECIAAGSQPDGTICGPGLGGLCCNGACVRGQEFCTDEDQDGHGDFAGVQVFGCPGTSPPPGFALGCDDCCDKDANVFAGRPFPTDPTQYPGITLDANGNVVGHQLPNACGTYDYNCDSVQTPLYTNQCAFSDFAVPAPVCAINQNVACDVCPSGATTNIPALSECRHYDPSNVSPNAMSLGATPPCGSVSQMASIFPQFGSATTCSGLGASGDPVFLDQLCF